MQNAVRIIDLSSLPWLPISEPFSKPAHSRLVAKRVFLYKSLCWLREHLGLNPGLLSDEGQVVLSVWWFLSFVWILFGGH